ncbi:MAG: M3 family metallopeptidase [Pseudobdellovibrionaceae bacterium]
MKAIREITEQLQTLMTEQSTRLWVQYTTGFDLGVTEAQRKLNEYQKDPVVYKTICDHLEKSQGPLEHRKAQILFNSFKKFHQSDKCNVLIEQIQELENSLMDFLNKSRMTLEGRELTSVELTKIINQSADRNLRRKAYESRIPLNKKLVDAGFIRLLDLRKELANASGFENFVSYRLNEDELSSEMFKDWKKETSSRRSLYQKKTQMLAQEHLNIENLEAWDFGYLEGRLCSYNNAKVDLSNFYEPIAKTFAKFGFDIRSLNISFDIYPRKNKSEWGYNFLIAPGKDSRVLANVTNVFWDYWVLLHETAHGVHFLSLDPEDIALNLGVSGIVAEGFANFFGDLCYSREFLSEVFPADEVEKAYFEFKDLEKVKDLQHFRTIKRILFDQELYCHEIRSLADINYLDLSMGKELLGEESFTLEAPWAYVIHHTIAPIYFHNYFLGDLMCDKMKRIAGNSPLEFGPFWRDKVLSPSGLYPFLELYEKVCGEKLSLSDYLDNHLLL